MWHTRRQTLPSARKEITRVKKKSKYKRPSLWQRFSLKNVDHFEDAILATGLGLHPNFMIPTKSRTFGSIGIVHLDRLRHLNMGHINERYHQGYFHPPRQNSQIREQQLKARDEVPIFPLRQVLKEARKSVQPVKIKLDRTLARWRSTTTISEHGHAEFDPNAMKGGFFTVEQGIGTGRGNSPINSRKWSLEDSDDVQDSTYNLSLVKQSGISPNDSEPMSEPDSMFSPVGKRLNKRAGKVTVWRDVVNPNTTSPLKPAPFRGLAAAAQKVHMELAFGPQPPGEKMWPMSALLRMAPPKELRTVTRISPEEQKLSLQKGLGIRAKTQMLDFAMKAEALRRQMDPAKYKDEARTYICKGVLHDNAQEFTQAVESYKKYLDICERIEDVEGQALAHNFIGCSIQENENLKLAATKNKNLKSQLLEVSIVEYEEALEHHKLAAEKSDVEGKFICYTNIGLLYTILSMWVKAAKYHKKALKCATILENPRGQCASVGNLGYLLYNRKKHEAAKVCMIRYLQICRVIKFVPGIARAHFYLGDIEAQSERYETALAEFEDALVAAKECKDTTIQTLCKVQIGVCKGSLALKDLAEGVETQSIFGSAQEE